MKDHPKISICLPVLNARRFLQQRIESILEQTEHNFEVVAVDDGSTDGTIEFLQTVCEQDSRFRLVNGPRKGLYAGWNTGIAECHGKYLYVATADDTMAQDCLRILSSALDSHPEAGIAQCGLTYISEHDQPLLEEQQWLATYPHRHILGEWLVHPHIRLQPIDALLHFTGDTVFTSMTQVLIRRNLLSKTGLFPLSFGPWGDFLFGLRCASWSPTLFLPECLATFRFHDTQASSVANSARSFQVEMVDKMLREACQQPSARTHDLCQEKLLSICTTHQNILMALDHPSGLRRISGLLSSLIHQPSSTISFVMNRMFGTPHQDKFKHTLLRREIDSLDIDRLIVPIRNHSPS